MTRVSSFAIPISPSLPHKSLAISTPGCPPPTEGLQDQEMATTFAMPPTQRKRCFADSISLTICGNEIRHQNFSCTRVLSSYNPKHGVKMWSFFHGGSPRLNTNYPGMEGCSQFFANIYSSQP
jgi:hypothetical protein